MPEPMATVLRRSVLNVGGGSKSIPIPDRYDGWEHLLLDVDRRGRPDIVCDARKLKTQNPGRFDAVYCSHNLEHYYSHDVPKVLKGFHHVLKPDGLVEIRVPDLIAVMEAVLKNGLDVTDVLYMSPAGPILVRDVIYGLGREIESSGKDFYAHKTGFGERSLREALLQSGFPYVMTSRDGFELAALAFKAKPEPARMEELGILLRP